MELSEILGNLTLSSQEIPARPDGMMGNTRMYHFLCTLRYGNGEFSFHYSQGLAWHTGRVRKSLRGHMSKLFWSDVQIAPDDERFIPSARGKLCPVDRLIGNMKKYGDANKFADLVYDPVHPTVVRVLSSLVTDCRIGTMSFEQFCDEFGADPDSRREYRTWEQCRDAQQKLTNLFGYEVLGFLISHEEELEELEGKEIDSETR